MRSFGAPAKGWSKVSRAGTVKDGAWCALLVAACGVLASYLPPLFLVAAVVIPSFPAVCVVRRSLATALVALVAATGLLVWPLAPTGAVFMVVQLALPGVVLGLLFKNRTGALKGFLGATAGQFFFTGVAWVWYWAVTGENPFSAASLRTAVDAAVAMYARSGGNPAAVGALTEAGRLMLLLWPGIVVVWLAGSMALAYFWTRFLLGRAGGPVSPVAPFYMWHLPWYGIWSIIAGLALWLAGSQFGWPLVNQAGANLLYVAAVVYLVLGLAAAAFHYRRLAGLRVVQLLLLVALVVAWQVTVPLLVVAGVVDSIVGLRRRSGKS